MTGTNTAKVLAPVVYLESYKGGLRAKEPKIRKDGEVKRTRNHKEEGVSSEVYAFRTAAEINEMLNIFNSEINTAIMKQKIGYITNNDKEKIARRNKLLFIIGINIGIRASDIRLLQWRNFFDDNGKFREFYNLKPQKTKKTGKFVKLYFNKAIKKAIKEYISVFPIEDYNDYLFSSKSGKPITVQTIWNVVKNTAKKAGITQNIGTHSLRKTWGYWVWHEAADKNMALVLLQKCFAHSSTEVTMKYIGISDEDIQGVYEGICLGFG